MASKKLSPPPTQDQVDRHWKAQDKAVSQPLHTRDPGVTIANTEGDVSRIIDAARDGEKAPAYKLRNTIGIIDDPLARTSDLIVKHHKGMSAKEFTKLIGSPLEQQVYLALYGDMKDFQRAQIWQRISKQAFDEQQAALAEAHRRHALDQKRTDQMLKGIAMQERIEAAKAKRNKPDGKVPSGK
ncbi:hypothetical protein HT136_23170 [Novosphingobium profundi]|uniref:hypothetical protein n=1 Tax=Novosphingobium profundi TaxID=1774954 RepID=UPI001BDA5DDB|nr:hypothetical protein [Novosphingobium profundi]MBT0671276.1 hypothetical protein [Novosphingobium profundi]